MTEEIPSSLSNSLSLTLPTPSFLFILPSSSSLLYLFPSLSVGLPLPSCPSSPPFGRDTPTLEAPSSFLLFRSLVEVPFLLPPPSAATTLSRSFSSSRSLSLALFLSLDPLPSTLPPLSGPLSLLLFPSLTRDERGRCASPESPETPRLTWTSVSTESEPREDGVSV